MHYGKIRVKSNENLLENYKSHHPSSQNSASLLSSANQRRKQNKNVNKNIRIKHSSFRGVSSKMSTSLQYRERFEHLPESLKFNKNAMTIFVRQEENRQNKRRDSSGRDATTTTSNDIENFENIICSPNFRQMAYNEAQNGGDGFDCDNVDYNDSAIDMTQEYHDGNDDSRLMINEDDDGHIGDNDEIVIEDPIIDRKPTFLPPLIPLRGEGGNEVQTKKMRDYLKEDLRRLEKLNFENCLLNGGPPPNTFVLRNPRGNQPRTYNTDALWAALMSVKSGESIYR